VARFQGEEKLSLFVFGWYIPKKSPDQESQHDDNTPDSTEEQEPLTNFAANLRAEFCLGAILGGKHDFHPGSVKKR